MESGNHMNPPDHVIATVIHERVRTPHHRQLALCPVCGDVEDQTSWTDASSRTSVSMGSQCQTCDDIERNHTVIFDWVLRVIKWHTQLHHPGPLCRSESGDYGRIRVCNLPLDDMAQCPAGCPQPVDGW